MTKTKRKECCPLMELVLSRARDTDALGMKREALWDAKTGEFTDHIIVRVRKIRAKDDPYANVTWVAMDWCPFCASRVNAKKPKRVKASKKK